MCMPPDSPSTHIRGIHMSSRLMHLLAALIPAGGGHHARVNEARVHTTFLYCLVNKYVKYVFVSALKQIREIRITHLCGELSAL